ncbi:MAG: hypothetical protein WBA29_14090, partial [Xanthobacteraceae bacterium]
LTRRGAEILVRIEKLLDEAGKSVGKTSATEPVGAITTGAAAASSIASMTSADIPPRASTPNN